MTDLRKYRILVTPTSYAKNDPTLRSELEAEVSEVVYNTTGHPLSSFELMEMITGCNGYIAGLDDIDRNVIEAANQLKVIARYGVGVDNIDLEAVKEKGIVVTNTPGANSASVAELTVGLLISLARMIPTAVEATKKSILDTLATILGASGTIPGCQEITELVKEAGGKEESSIMAFGGRVPAWMAAFANGSTSS